MRAVRKEAAPARRRLGTEPGLGTLPAGSHGPQGGDDDESSTVDFDALHAALGDPSSGSGRPRAHTIPPAHVPTDDPDAPLVMVARDDTVPSAPPRMTTPLAPAVRQSFRPSLPTPDSLGRDHPDFSPGAAFPRRVPSMTARMPDRPMHPGRGRIPTVVLRPVGPSSRQQLLVFLSMLLLVIACGIGVVLWREPSLIGFESTPGTPAAHASAPLFAPAGGTTHVGISQAASAREVPVAIPTAAPPAKAIRPRAAAVRPADSSR